MRSFNIFFFISVLSLSAQAQLLFEEGAVAVGVDVSCGNTFMGNGVSFVDYDLDGWDDITLTTGASQGVRFFKNTNGMFSEDFPTIPTTVYQTKCLNWVDYDNDGDKDIFLTSDTVGNKLFENTGNLVFQDVTVAAGFPTTNTFTFGASWGDIDNDGNLDVYLCNRDANFLIKNQLFRNNGDGTFSDISATAGVDISQISFCSAFLDYNNDGYQDIYVSNDRWFTSNYLFKNNGDGTFDDVSQISGTDLEIDAMSVTVDDYNNDGWFDIYVTNNPGGNVFLKNNGDGTFTDIAMTTGTSFNSHGWGAAFFDAENDMDLDLYVSGSYVGPNTDWISAAFYKRTGPEMFEIPTDAGFLNDEGSSYSNAIGDINNDGLPEIIVNNIADEPLQLWRNQTTTSNNWLKVKLEGTASNRDGIGSIIEMGISGNAQYRYTLCGEGYLGQNSNYELFGMGSNTSADYVKVTWLSGIVDYFYNVSANQVLEVTEGSGTLSISDSNETNVTLYPNPVKSTLNIESRSSLVALQLYDLLGQEILNLTEFVDRRNSIEIGDLSSGTYIVKILLENGDSTIRKIIKK